MYIFFTKGGAGSTVLAAEMDIIPLEMDMARLFKYYLQIDGDFPLNNYRLLKRKLVKSKRNKHLNRSCVLQRVQLFFYND